MAQGKQAKILSEGQIRATQQYLSTTRNSLRDIVICLLSVKSGLRAKEIACRSRNPESVAILELFCGWPQSEGA